MSYIKCTTPLEVKYGVLTSRFSRGLVLSSSKHASLVNTVETLPLCNYPLKSPYLSTKQLISKCHERKEDFLHGLKSNRYIRTKLVHERLVVWLAGKVCMDTPWL